MKVLFLVAASLIAVFVILLGLFLYNSQSPTPKPLPVTQDFNKNYNNFNFIEPGKGKYDDVVKLNGKPQATNQEGAKLTLYYKTPNSTFDNIVVLENGVVKYAIEYVFSSYRGFYDEYLEKYGGPDISLYLDDQEDLNPTWFVFLKHGLAVESSNNEITRIAYFIPQTKEKFMEEIGVFLGLSETPPEIHEDLPELYP